MAIGAGIGIIGGLLATVLDIGNKDDSSSSKEMLLDDPSVPNTKEVAPEIYNLFCKFVGPLHNLCPDTNKKKYRSTMRKVMQTIEVVMVSYRKLQERKDIVTLDHINECFVLLTLSITYAQRTIPWFHTGGIVIVKEHVEALETVLLERFHDMKTMAGHTEV